MRRIGVVLGALALVVVVACGGDDGDGGPGGGDDASGGAEGAALIDDAQALVDECRADATGGSATCDGADLDGFTVLCAALDPSLAPGGVLVLPEQAPEPANVNCRGDGTIVNVTFLGDGASDPCDAVECGDDVDGVRVAVDEGRVVLVGDGVHVDVLGDDVSALAATVAANAFGIEIDAAA